MSNFELPTLFDDDDGHSVPRNVTTRKTSSSSAIATGGRNDEGAASTLSVAGDTDRRGKRSRSSSRGESNSQRRRSSRRSRDSKERSSRKKSVAVLDNHTAVAYSPFLSPDVSNTSATYDYDYQTFSGRKTASPARTVNLDQWSPPSSPFSLPPASPTSPLSAHSLTTITNTSSEARRHQEQLYNQHHPHQHNYLQQATLPQPHPLVSKIARAASRTVSSSVSSEESAGGLGSTESDALLSGSGGSRTAGSGAKRTTANTATRNHLTVNVNGEGASGSGDFGRLPPDDPWADGVDMDIERRKRKR